jgi:Cu-Zn family superoxide dismutase
MKRTLFLFLVFPLIATSESLSIDMYAYGDKSDQGIHIGQVLIEDSPLGGVLITPQLHPLPTGVHGFHIHALPSCAHTEADGHIVIAGAAGSHFDPAKTNVHAGPYGSGHVGDLPVLVVNEQKIGSLPTLAPRIKTADLHGHVLMVHLGGDNYSDNPSPNGGGGARLACGIIQ